ncbi:MAG: phage terminase large subunit family protein [Chloroflexota bacterium]
MQERTKNKDQQLRRKRSHVSPQAVAVGSIAREGARARKKRLTHRQNLKARMANPALAMPMLPWMYKYRPYLAEGRPFETVEHKMLLGPYCDEHPTMMVMKAAQIGFTDMMLSKGLRAAQQFGATVLFTFPVDKHVSDFSSQRVGPAIEASIELSRIAESVKEAGKSNTSRVTLKRIYPGWMYFRGSKVKPDGSAPQLKSIPADYILMDEVDECDARAMALVKERLGHSLLKREFYVSTPTYPEFGIHAEFLKSDQCLWMIPCPHCGTRQNPTIDDIVIEWDALDRPVTWHGQSEDRAYIACQHCHKELDRFADGEWIPQYPSVSYRGYHATKFFFPFVDLIDLVRALDTSNPTKQREVRNQGLGIPFRGKGEGISKTALDACKRNYLHPEKNTTGRPCFMGVDVGKVLHVVIRAAPDGQGARHQLLVKAVENFDELGRLIRRYKPACVVIDALPESRKVLEFQKAHWGLVFPAYYPGQGLKTTDPYQLHLPSETSSKAFVQVDRTRMLDEVFERVTDEVNTLPVNIEHVDRDYYKHMRALNRKLVDTPDGGKRAKWEQIGDDHYAHAEAYCATAAYIGNMIPNIEYEAMSLR